MDIKEVNIKEAIFF